MPAAIGGGAWNQFLLRLPSVVAALALQDAAFTDASIEIAPGNYGGVAVEAFGVLPRTPGQ